ncbi:MAG: iron(III) transport system ATP-binding protein [Flavobacteriales bacterium]|jgi:iron(III) transport system ATP-binding protein
MIKQIILQHISKTFDTLKVLNDVNLTINEGEQIALVGQSGSGKTTLLRIIAGLEKTDSGTVQYDKAIWQNEQQFMSPEKRNIGFVFQDYALFPHLTVNKNILFGAKEFSHDLDNTLTQFELSELSDRYPHELSGGQQQRVAIARAVIRKPQLLLLDEPFSNLDDSLKNQLRLFLKDTLKKLNITSILVTHDMKDAFLVSDKIALLNQGKLEQYNTPTALYEKPKNLWVASFLGEVNQLEIDGEKHYFRNEHVVFNPQSNTISTVVDSQFMGGYHLLSLDFEGQAFKTNYTQEIPQGESFPFEITKTLAWHE